MTLPNVRKGPGTDSEAPPEAIHHQEDPDSTVTRPTDNPARRTAERTWRAEVQAALEVLAEVGEPFGIDAVRELGVPEPCLPQRWGIAIACASRAGLIRFAGLSLNSNGRPCRLWVGRSS